MSRTRKCYIDCTNTLHEEFNTGIQRVVRNIIERCKLSHIDAVEFIPVFAAYNTFYRFNAAAINPLAATKAVNRVLGSIRNAIDKSFGILRNQNEEENAETRRPGSERGPGGLHTVIVGIGRSFVPTVLSVPFLIDKAMHKFQPVTFDTDDILFLPDVFWIPVLKRAVKQAQVKKTIHILLLHDIFPLLYPHLNYMTTVDGFIQHFPFFFRWADGVLSVSQTALDDIKKYGSRLGHSPHYDYFHLGADFRMPATDNGPIRDTIVSIFQDSLVYLMVGTIEPRKNHRYVLETFRRLWEREVNISLCIIGRIGWKCKEVLDEISSSFQYGARLFMIHDATDVELAYCYARTKAVIIASVAEGFGLPLIEALYSGKQVFASDIPVFREIGQGHPIFFSIAEPADLERKILEFESEPHPAAKSEFTHCTWDESVNDLFQKIVKMADSIRPGSRL